MSYISAKIDDSIKKQAIQVLKAQGWNMSDFLRYAVNRVVRENTIPFDKVPNAETLQAMKEALDNRQHPERFKKFNSEEDFMNELKS